MKFQFGMIFLCLLIVSCSSKRKIVNSPLFNKSAAPETKEELESLPKVTQEQVIDELSPAPVKPAPQPRTLLAANRKAPPPTANVTPIPDAFTRTPAANSQDYIIYIAKGGEKISFVARSLLGSPKKVSLLKGWNPGLTSDTLEKNQKVNVKVEALKPQTIYLSRDLVIKYKTQLHEHFKKKSPTKNCIVKAGETLQTISQQLYSTTRRWTELYLLNYDKMTDPDSLEKGTNLKYY